MEVIGKDVCCPVFNVFGIFNVLTSRCVDLQWYPSHVTGSREGAFNQWER